MPTPKFLNDEGFQFISCDGTWLTAQKSDFRDGVKINCATNATETGLLKAVGEMIAYHALNVRPLLNGFSGYNTISYTVIRNGSN